MDDIVNSIKLDKHQTRDISDQHVNGSLTVIWRDWDNIVKNEPKMVYVSSINPGEIKGPHLHTKRNSYFVCVHGKVVFIIQDKHGKYREIESSDKDPVLIHVPKNYPSAHINLSKSTSTVLVLADVAWRPNDDEMKNISFDDYDLSKWNKY
jgi:dTDP-4-dehydrorhamnose 3,5-epimerase